MNEQKERAWNDIFALRLAELMKNRGMRQSELAVGIGSPQNTVGRYIKGRLCKVSELLKIAKFLVRESSLNNRRPLCTISVQRRMP